MGIRIHKAIGYGMPLQSFEEHSILEDHGDGKIDTLSDLLYNTNELIISEKEDDELLLSHRGSSLCLNLLVEDLDKYIRNPENAIQLSSAHSLFKIIEIESKDENLDYEQHVVFFPNAILANRWFRCDDDIDYYETLSKIDSLNFMTESNIKYLSRGPYPYSHNVLDLEGNPILHSYPRELDNKEWIAMLPAELWWWLQHLKVFDKKGITQIKPLMATWWS